MRRLPRRLAQPINRASLPMRGVTSATHTTEVTQEQIDDQGFPPKDDLIWEARAAFDVMDRDAYGDDPLWTPWSAQVQSVSIHFTRDDFALKAQEVIQFMVRRPRVLVVVGFDYESRLTWRNVLASWFVGWWGKGSPL